MCSLKNPFCQSIAISSVCAGVVALSTLASQALACVAGAPDCVRAAPAINLPTLLSADPVAGRVTSHLDGKPWIAQAWTTLPVAVGKSDDLFSLQASLDHYSAFEDRKIAKKVAEAQTIAPDRVVVPKPPVSPNKRIDVWGAVDIDAAEHGKVARSRVGVDYQAWQNTVVGAMLDVDPEGAATSFGRGQRFATYVVMKLPSFASVDATADWGEGLVDEQYKLAVNLRGNVEMPGGIRFSPTVGMTGIYAGETEVEGGDQESDHGTLSFAPRFSRSFELDKGATIEPHVAISTDTDDKRSAGAGVTVQRPDAYSLSLGTTVERNGETEQPTMRGNLNLTVPLP